MVSRKSLSIVIMLAVIVIISCEKKESSVKRSPDAEKIAVVATDQWLELIDNGRYSESWELAAELFKRAIEKEAWNRQLNAVREPLGKLIDRKVTRKEYMTSMPGAPDGEYVIIQYRTSFENKKNAIETVTPMKDKDGQWRISGYYIK
ncbi:DUF4019 domain-containing protein [candidate division WOR-3 bacterium]|nr:DUF4019 domain-containing protein [candidate division WOR-3 bacterium]